MYDALNTNSNNMFSSLYSIVLAFTLLYEGSESYSRDNLRYFLNLDIADGDLRSSNAKIYNDLYSDQSQYQLNIANSFWMQNDYGVNQDYLDLIEKYYNGQIAELDFSAEPESSRQEINDWIYDRTSEKIKDLLPRGSITSLTKFVLANAIYFKSEWVYEFDVDDMSEYPFTSLNGDEDEIDFMNMYNLDDVDFNYQEDDDYQLLELPYKGLSCAY